MKKINIVRSWLIGSFVLFGITSCTAGFEDANRPGHETSLEVILTSPYPVFQIQKIYGKSLIIYPLYTQ